MHPLALEEWWTQYLCRIEGQPKTDSQQWNKVDNQLNESHTKGCQQIDVKFIVNLVTESKDAPI